MKKVFNSILIIAAAAILVVSCASQNGQKENIIFKDMNIDMVQVEGGSIQGSLKYNSNSFKEGMTVEVKNFAVSQAEVTQELYAKIMADNDRNLNATPSEFKGTNLPVEHVTWFDAVYFCNVLSEQSGFVPAYTIEKVVARDGHIVDAEVTCDATKSGYRLPSETEWEFAARSGKKMENYLFAGSSNPTDVSWTSANSNKEPHPVKSKKPNTLQIYDMSGNVWEWIQDSYGLIDSSVREYKMIKGGGWFNYVNYATVNGSFIWDCAEHDSDLGFRVVRTL